MYAALAELSRVKEIVNKRVLGERPPSLQDALHVSLKTTDLSKLYA